MHLPATFFIIYPGPTRSENDEDLDMSLEDEESESVEDRLRREQTRTHISEYRAFSQSIVVFFFNSRPRLRSLFCHNCAAREQDPNFLVFNP